ncbi:MAG: alpha-amylase, partial [Chloroflexi bacterium]|nr:alpha-amylase [Chloroflexota bacterium]
MNDDQATAQLTATAQAAAGRPIEVPVARVARERYDFDEPLMPPTELPAAAARGARRLARRMAERRSESAVPPPRAGQLQAMTVIHEAMHQVIDRYRDRDGASIFGEALLALDRDVGADPLNEALRAHAAEFPVASVFRGDVAVDQYLEDRTGQQPHREVVLEELLLLWLTNRNPAFVRHGELFDEWPVARASLYAEIVEGLRRSLAGVVVPSVDGAGGHDLVTMLLAPSRAAPESLAGQLRYIRENWPGLTDLIDGVVPDLDRLAALERGAADDEGDEDAEEAAPMATPVTGIGAPGPTQASALDGFTGLDAEPERYSLDREWMPRLVLLAKSTYVWLDQLSRTYGRPIRTLDAIPDEELDRLGAAGLSGLWLIGVWERSPASQRIKQMRGNPEAVASAYSLMDYRISADLGGEEAFAALRERARSRGIRLACDMVPNHMGIDSRWVVDHPERFISRSDSPYPAYSFTGPNLSSDERVGIYLEDHYQDSSDAAVVFKRADRWSGQEAYIFHGNDGTGMPWNDTAQLDYLRADVREAVIQTILAVAHRAPVIRFDAAMTLARRHVQRLWYPLPDSGESIPSRSDAAMEPEEFARLMPAEFWREVVDRVAAEAPDTLLLAEAFWLMEGYFVRNLGMHRVYNSAFMHMLRDEDNGGYRTVLRNTLAFDPEILKRYVNFMSNPDERSAIDQFGDGDKYFGVATLMATLPGLPMFGHGQVEGFAERYGMEFRRARLDEQPDAALMERHEREIFPLLHQRALFAEARDFLLFDLVGERDFVEEDVYAFANQEGDRRALIVFHNRYAEVHGRIHWSMPVATGENDGDQPLRGRSLAEGLGLPEDPDAWLILRDLRSGREWLRDCAGIHQRGLDLELQAYECRIFLDPVVVRDGPTGVHARLAARLSGSSVPSVEEALRELVREPAREAIARLLDEQALRRMAGAALGRDDVAAQRILDQEAARLDRALSQLEEAADGPGEERGTAARTLERRLRRLIRMVRTARLSDGEAGSTIVTRWLGKDRTRWLALLGWAYLDALRSAIGPQREGPAWMTIWEVEPLLRHSSLALGLDDGPATHGIRLARALVASTNDPITSVALPASWLSESEVRESLGISQWQGETYVERDAFGMFVEAVVARDALDAADGADAVEGLEAELRKAADKLKARVEAAGWRVG